MNKYAAVLRVAAALTTLVTLAVNAGCGKSSSLNDNTSASLPFDMSLTQARAAGGKLIVELAVKPSTHTRIDEGYSLQCVSTKGDVLPNVWTIRFKGAEQEQRLSVQLPDDVAARLFPITDSGKEALAAVQNRDKARNRLASAETKQEEFWYNYYTGGSLPSYDAKKRMDQELKDAKQALAATDKEVSRLEALWRGNRVLEGVHLHNITPYLRVTIIPDPPGQRK